MSNIKIVQILDTKIKLVLFALPFFIFSFKVSLWKAKNSFAFHVLIGT